MNAPLLTYRMTVEQFLDWAEARAAALPYDEPKWELFDGVPEMQEHEQWRHGRNKLAVWRTFADAVEARKLPLEIALDSLGVRIGPNSSYQPEVVIFPKGLIKDDDRHAPDPVIVVEVLSPSTRNKDLKTKAIGYARVPTIQHYLVIDPEAGEVLRYRRNGSELIPDADSLKSGTLRLDPPGIELDVAAIVA